MKKSEYKFRKNVQKQIESDAKPNTNIGWWEKAKPIFIPKRKKYK